MVRALRPLSKGSTIAIIDDEADERDRLSESVEDADFEPLQIDLPLGIDELISSIVSSSSAAVCDLRLTKYANVQYWGSEVVARLNEMNVPAVLISSGVNAKTNMDVRKWRSGIPKLITRQEGSDPESLTDALDIAYRELKLDFTPERKPYRTVVRIARIEQEPSGAVADVVSIGWNPDREVKVPLSVFIDDVGDLALDVEDERFIADVNIYALDDGDLYFRNIHRAPEIPGEWLRD